MTEQEEKINDLQRHSVIQDARISNLETKFEMFMNEMRDFKNETRDRDNRRAEEISEIRNDIKEISKTTDAKIEAIRTTIDSTNQHIRNLSYASIGAIAAMVITVLLNLPK